MIIVTMDIGVDTDKLKIIACLVTFLHLEVSFFVRGAPAVATPASSPRVCSIVGLSWAARIQLWMALRFRLISTIPPLVFESMLIVCVIVFFFFLRLIEGLFLYVTLQVVQPVACCSVQHHQVSFTTVQRTLAGNVLFGLVCSATLARCWLPNPHELSSAIAVLSVRWTADCPSTSSRDGSMAIPHHFTPVFDWHTLIPGKSWSSWKQTPMVGGDVLAPIALSRCVWTRLSLRLALSIWMWFRYRENTETHRQKKTQPVIYRSQQCDTGSALGASKTKGVVTVHNKTIQRSYALFFHIYMNRNW